MKSEVYLTEVLESICEKMDDYSLYYDPKTKEKSFKRFAPRDSEDLPSLDFNNFQFNPADGSPLKFAVSCSVWCFLLFYIYVCVYIKYIYIYLKIYRTF